MPEQFDELYNHIKKQLTDNLSPYLYYHGVNHTFVDVLPAAEALAASEKLSPEDMLIVRTAALLHDTGYLKQYKENEPIGCDIARELLPDYGYSQEQIDSVCDCIMATQLPQKPVNLLAQIVCDADLSHLGTQFFFLRSEGLRLELSHEFQKDISQRHWHTQNVEFLKKHTYFTESAKKMYLSTKEKNIAATLELLGNE